MLAFDIVGHTVTDQHEVMLARVRGVNQLVGKLLQTRARGSVLWASGGDGGHVLFLDDDWQTPLLELLRDLRTWAEREAVPLRIGAHHGPLEVIPGADGRLQPVGEAINTAAWILTRASSAGIVVSAQFRIAFGSRPGVEFHDRRPLRSKHGNRPQALHLMSLTGLGRRSEWSDPVAADQDRLREAADRGEGLEAVYWAKRLMQVNGGDRAVTGALARIRPEHFGHNPVLGHLSAAALRRVIELGDLIELQYNEYLCRSGDSGRTMFLILRGQIGVDSPNERPKRNGARRLATLSEGAIVGELAFALDQRRTADLISLGDTAVLSFDYEQLSKLLKQQGHMILEFMTGRALEHVSQHVPYLVGRPLSALPEPERREWQELLAVLQSGCHIITREAHQRLTLADIRRRDRRTAAGGIYILAAGHLESVSIEGKELDGEGFPLLYVDLPDLVVAPDHEYTVDRGPARLIFIRREAINQLPATAHGRLIRELKHELRSLYHYDVFMSYNFGDERAAERLERALRDMGLAVFRDSPAHLGERYPERDAGALLDSLVLLVLVSEHAMLKAGDRSWLLKEVRFREQHFEKPQIVPIRLPGGDPQQIGLMYPTIDAEADPEAAAQKVAVLVRAIRSGEAEPPYGHRRPRLDHIA